MKELLLGGARSGKSRLAEAHASALNKPVIFIATATADDEEMTARIRQHQATRPADWILVEEPVYLSRVIENHGSQDVCLLIDCLTLWISNLLHSTDIIMAEEIKRFIRSLVNTSADMIMVSNEVGSGIIPLGELSRQFVDESGRLHQQLAGICDQVSLVVAGLEQKLKG